MKHLGARLEQRRLTTFRCGFCRSLFYSNSLSRNQWLNWDVALCSGIPFLVGGPSRRCQLRDDEARKAGLDFACSWATWVVSAVRFKLSAFLGRKVFRANAGCLFGGWTATVMGGVLSIINLVTWYINNSRSVRQIINFFSPGPHLRIVFSSSPGGIALDSFGNRSGINLIASEPLGPTAKVALGGQLSLFFAS